MLYTGFLGTNIRRLRFAGKLTAAEVAYRMRLDQSIPSRWEHNARPVPPYLLEALAEALGTDVATLLGDQAPPAPVKPFDLSEPAPIEVTLIEAEASVLEVVEQVTAELFAPSVPRCASWSCVGRHPGGTRLPHPSVTVMTIAAFWGGMDSGPYVARRKS